MKLKKTRYDRTCTTCKSPILKGSKYGQRSITLGSKKDGQSETFDGVNIVVHQMRVKVDICEACATRGVEDSIKEAALSDKYMIEGDDKAYVNHDYRKGVGV